MTSLWEHMYSGMGAAAWAWGFMVILGIGLLVLGTVGYLVLALLKSDEPEGEEGKDDDGDADPFDLPPDAPRMGKHLRKGAQ